MGRIFHEELAAFFTNPERIAAHLVAANQALEERGWPLAVHEQAIHQIREEMNRTHRFCLDGHITTQGCGGFNKPAEERPN